MIGVAMALLCQVCLSTLVHFHTIHDVERNAPVSLLRIHSNGIVSGVFGPHFQYLVPIAFSSELFTEYSRHYVIEFPEPMDTIQVIVDDKYEFVSVSNVPKHMRKLAAVENKALVVRLLDPNPEETVLLEMSARQKEKENTRMMYRVSARIQDHLSGKTRLNTRCVWELIIRPLLLLLREILKKLAATIMSNMLKTYLMDFIGQIMSMKPPVMDALAQLQTFPTVSEMPTNFPGMKSSPGVSLPAMPSMDVSGVNMPSTNGKSNADSISPSTAKVSMPSNPSIDSPIADTPGSSPSQSFKFPKLKGDVIPGLQFPGWSTQPADKKNGNPVKAMNIASSPPLGVRVMLQLQAKSMTQDVKSLVLPQLTRNLKANLMDIAGEQLTQGLSKAIEDEAMEEISGMIIRKVSRTLITDLTHNLTSTLTKTISNTTRDEITRTCGRNIMQMLVESLSPALSLIISDSLSYNEVESHACYFCENKRPGYCGLCTLSRAVASGRQKYSAFFAEYYGSYYSSEYAKSFGPRSRLYDT